eukprot:1789762-Ditylum_brightwellii.AAC.1
MSGLCCSGLGEIGQMISEACGVPLVKACLGLVTIDHTIEKWLNDMEGYIYHLPQERKVLSPQLLIADETIDAICVVHK